MTYDPNEEYAKLKELMSSYRDHARWVNGSDESVAFWTASRLLVGRQNSIADDLCRRANIAPKPDAAAAFFNYIRRQYPGGVAMFAAHVMMWHRSRTALGTLCVGPDPLTDGF